MPLWTGQGRTGKGIACHLTATTYGTWKARIEGVVEIDPEPGPVLERDEDRPAPLPRSEPTKTEVKYRVPVGWRHALTGLVHRLVVGDYDGLEADGYVHRDPDDVGISHWIEDYPDRLVDLPEGAWDYSDHRPAVGMTNAWSIVLPLWTENEHPSDLSLEAVVWDDGTTLKIRIDEVHVM